MSTSFTWYFSHLWSITSTGTPLGDITSCDTAIALSVTTAEVLSCWGVSTDTELTHGTALLWLRLRLRGLSHMSQVTWYPCSFIPWEIFCQTVFAHLPERKVHLCSDRVWAATKSCLVFSRILWVTVWQMRTTRGESKSQISQGPVHSFVNFLWDGRISGHGQYSHTNWPLCIALNLQQSKHTSTCMF